MSIIGESILTVSFEMLFKKLASTELLNFARQEQLHADLKKWEKILVKIRAVLEDAEVKQGRRQSVKIWLGELQNLAYDVEDILDEFATEAFRRKLLEEPQASVSKVWKLIPSCCSSLNPQAVKFNSRMVYQMKEITTRLQDITAQKDLLDLKEYLGGKSTKVGQRLPTTSLVNETKVYGRKEDQDAIVELLLRDDLNPEDGVSVIPIIGMGGVGKTTLAQLAYNDTRLEGHFDLKVWVCVSEEFDVIRITKTILRYIGFMVGGVDDLNMLQEKLRRKLLKKKFLFVLDDIWNENPNNWTALRRPFEVGLPSSKIIVTTRNQGVAIMMGTLPPYPLKELSNEACLSVFTQYALGQMDFSMHQHLKEIGEKIVKRCNGLPLAAQTLGGLLHGKVDPNNWDDVLNCKIWDLPEDKSDILPALRVSYHYLPSYLKRCFAYCSLFPKDYEFSKEEIVLLWMVEGFLQDENNKKMEDLGYQFFHDLKSRSFFQQASKNISRFVMHDLINDLAQWAAGEIYFRMDKILDCVKQRNIAKNIRYLSYICDRFECVKKFEAFYDAKHLRTFLPVGLPTMGSSYLTSEVLYMFPKLPYLRAVSLRNYRISELPNRIGELKHLRYLDLSHTGIETLPESINLLYNLETLLLENCFHLKKMCADMGNLINLRHLDNSNADALEEMPLRFGNLTGLLTLPNFVVGNGSGSRLEELKSLTHIRNKLRISGLETVNAQDAKKADLNGKRDINVLELVWTSRIGHSREAGNETHVLDMLRPQQDLKELIISCYGGTTFPIWLGDSSFSNLAFLTLEKCMRCTFLPSVGRLPFLKDLVIRGMAGVKNVAQEFYTCSEPFPSLETLCFEDMKEWADWNPRGPNQEVEMFPHLRDLSIIDCPKLVGRLPDRLPSLESLVIRSCKQLSVSVPSLPTLCRLEIEGCKQVVRGSTINLSSLNSLLLSDISDHICPTERFTQGLSKVEELNIVGCKELTSLWQSRVELLQDNSFLCRLVIERCPQLHSLVAEEEEQQLQSLPCRLQYLKLKECESFMKLPQAFCNISSLTEISIKDCPKLVSFPESGMPPQLRIVGVEQCDALKSFPESWMHSSNKYLEHLSIEECHSLTFISRVHLPPNLKRLVIRFCENLRTLLDDGVSIVQEAIIESENRGNTSHLEYLEVISCPSLKSLWSKSALPDTLEHIQLWDCSNLVSLSSRGNLPKSLKDLMISDCSKLESIANTLQNQASLRSVQISQCDNINFLLEDLQKFSNLKEIMLANCPSLVSFPQGGLPSNNLTALCMYNCEKLEALPAHMHNLTSLRRLSIAYCPSLVSFPVHGLPISLTSLYIGGVKICKQLFQWGLHRLTFLKYLIIDGGCPDVVAFPQDEIGMMLPSSLIHLTIENFPNLERISSDIHNFTSLEELSLLNCSKLKSFPAEGLPSSILKLIIRGCHMLQQRCERGRGLYWPMIAAIPYVIIDFK